MRSPRTFRALLFASLSSCLLLAGCSDDSPKGDARLLDARPADAASDADAGVDEAGADSNADAAQPSGVITKLISGTGAVRDRRLAIDKKGNVYLCARFNGEVDFGGKKHVGNGYDALLVAFDAAFNYRWSKSFGSAKPDRAFDVTTDDAANVYVVGTFEDSVDIEGTKLTSDGGIDGFVVSYDSRGKLRWVKRLAGNAYAVTINAAGNAVVGGSFSGSVTLGTATLDAGGGNSGFVAALDGNGDVSWARSLGGTDVSEIVTLVPGAGGGVVAGGSFQVKVDPGKGELTSLGNSDALLVGYDATGKTSWQRSWGNGLVSRVNDAARDASGNIYVTGIFRGDIVHGSTTLSATGTPDSFVLQFDASGAPGWGIRLAPSRGNARLNAIAWSGSHLVAAGALNGDLGYNGKSLSTDAQIYAGGLIVAMDASGKPSWSRVYEAAKLDAELTGVVASGARAYVTGSFFGKTTVEGKQLESMGVGPDTLLLSFESN